MWDVIGILGFLGTGAGLAGALVSAFKRDGRWKKWLAGAGIAFLLFVVGAVNSPTNDKPNQPTETSVQQQEKTTSEQKETNTRTDQKDNSASVTENSRQFSQAPKQERSPVALQAAGVLRVVDGDTIVVSYQGREEKVRFIGVNTPESTIRHEPYGEEASNFTKSRLSGRTVYLEKDVSERDKYGRLLRYAWLEPPKSITESEIRSKMFNAVLLLEGYAQVATYPPDVKYVDYFTKFQREARENEKGLWELTAAPVQSSSPSQTSSVQVEASYIGNSNSKKFHRLDCIWAAKISPANRVEFRTRQDAIAQGYVPCKICNP